MDRLTPLENIKVPSVMVDESYSFDAFGKTYRFRGLKQLLGAADFSKAGDRGAGLAAANEVEREAARSLLSKLTLGHLWDRPLADEAGNIDEVLRVNYDVDVGELDKVRAWTLGDFKNWLLSADGDVIGRAGFGLTGVMAAAVAKLCDTHELICIARKISRPAKARTHLGLPGTLSSRCQPNHPTDDLRGLTLLAYQSWSLGGGDALVGVNPAIDTVDNILAMLVHLDKIRRKHGVPTQNCVLAHVKTQLGCLDRGAPVEIMFQSLAGTDRTLHEEFDVTVQVLDGAYRRMKAEGPIRDAENFFYFETGQGSEFTYAKHNGIDMTTLEALCYGLARRYRPFMVNNVTGFIGPETHVDNFEMIVSNLQDHFMGKLLGVPMGMAPCYTLHSKITLEGQQMATELLASAGANYYMDVALNTDRMLAYFDTSGHDNQTLRELTGRKPAPEYFEWAKKRGIFDEKGNRGPKWGDVRAFCDSDGELADLLAVTPSMYGLANAGPRPAESVTRELKLHQAAAREATYAELDFERLATFGKFREVKTRASSKEAHLGSPTLGSFLDPESESRLKPEGTDVQLVISDGLSAEAVHHNVADLWPTLDDGFRAMKLSAGETIVARYGRVKLAEAISEKLRNKLTVLLVGERPGGNAEASRSLSAYLVYRVEEEGKTRYEYTVLSNIYSKGLPAAEAGSVIVDKVAKILKHRAAGNRLEALLNAK